MPTGPLDHDHAFASGVLSSEPTDPDHSSDADHATDPDHTDAATSVMDTAPAVSTDPWLALLDIVAAGDLRLTLTAPNGGRAVLVAEDELAALQAAASTARTRPATLTPRERQVLQRVAAGDSIADASAQLGMTVSTMSQHLASARRKYGVHTTADAVAMAHKASQLT